MLAKERATVLLEMLAGKLRLQEACQQLGIRETRLHQLRQVALQGLVHSLEPGLAGRPRGTLSAEAERIAELEAAFAEKSLALQQALVRTEVALILPHPAESEKRGSTATVKLRKRKPR
jgi:hypothetical protein